MNATIRWATPDDAAVIHGFIVELAAYERAPDAVESTSEVIRGQLASPAPPFECLIAEDEGAPAGFALFFTNYSTWRGRTGIYIEDIYVPPRARGRGIGFALFRAVGRLAHERGAGRVEWSVLDWNAAAIAFYERLGAERLGEWTTYRLSGPALAALPGLTPRPGAA